MEDDELHDSGLGGLAWFQLGRASVESEASLSRSLKAVFGPRTPAIDVNQLLAENQALAAQNAWLRQELETYRMNYDRLNDWAKMAQRDLKFLREKQGA